MQPNYLRTTAPPTGHVGKLLKLHQATFSRWPYNSKLSELSWRSAFNWKYSMLFQSPLIAVNHIPPIAPASSTWPRLTSFLCPLDHTDCHPKFPISLRSSLAPTLSKWNLVFPQPSVTSHLLSFCWNIFVSSEVQPLVTSPYQSSTEFIVRSYHSLKIATPNLLSLPPTLLLFKFQHLWEGPSDYLASACPLLSGSCSLL
jgi:hypothetical protein